MLIRSQNKGSIVNAIEVRMDAMFADKKRLISARYAGQTFFHSNSVVLGIYPDEGTASKELDDLAKFFNENPSGIYQMK